MPRIDWTYEAEDRAEAEDDPLKGETVTISVTLHHDGSVLLDDVLVQGTYTAIPRLRPWALRQLDDLHFLDRVYEADDEDRSWGRAA
jgi:hypothetical protein